MSAITYSFTDLIQEYAAQNEWAIAEIDEKHAIFPFRMESGRTQILYIYKYASVLEFSVPSLARFQSGTEIPDQLSTLLLIRNSQKKIGFWCIEKIQEKLIFSFMHNIELRLLDANSFIEIVRQLVLECDNFEECLPEPENDQNSVIQELSPLQDILSYLTAPESLQESLSKTSIKQNKSLKRNSEYKFNLTISRKDTEESDSQIDISNISFERVRNFSEFIGELKKLSNELQKSNNYNIIQANNEIREAIQEADKQEPNGLVMLKKLQNAWEFTKENSTIIGLTGLIPTAIATLLKMMQGLPMV